MQKSADTDIEKKQKIMRIPDAHIQTRKNSVSASTSGRAGFFRTDIAFLILLFFVGVLGMHVYSVNSNAVQGYQVRQLEKEIASRQEENYEKRRAALDGKVAVIKVGGAGGPQGQ